MIWWEWLGEGEITKDVVFARVLSEVPSEHAGGYIYEELCPTEKESFEARGLTRAELNVLKLEARKRVQPNVPYTLYEKGGGTVEGFITSLRWSMKELNGTNLLVVRIELLVVPGGPL